MSAFCLLALLLAAVPQPNSVVQDPPAMGQGQAEAVGNATITGTITDPTGALIPGAVVRLERAGQRVGEVTADSGARFAFGTLPPGSYALTATSPGFAERRLGEIVLAANGRRAVTLMLPIEATQQQIEVGPEGATLDPGQNADATVLKGAGLATLSNDNSVMLQQLQALGGDGDGAGQIYVDGFSGGKVPPKSAIREIRINQNPYSAEYDTVGNGRIEIFTKPGSDAFHGDVFGLGSTSSFDSRNPYSPVAQPFYSAQYGGDVSGPITKKSSFSFTDYQFTFQNSAIVNATVLDAADNQAAFTDAVPSPTTTISLSPRYDAQLGKNNTLTARYELDRTTQTNAGVGQFALASQGYDSRNTVHTLQVSDTQTFGPKVVNELRFQYLRTRAFQGAISAAPALVVQGAFTGGGNNLGRFTDNQDQYEIQNYLSWEKGSHFFRFGVRQRLNRDSNRSTANYNGEYIFSTLTAYQRTVQGLAQGLTPAEIRASGGGASQFNITAGAPSAAILVADTGLYADDTWKARKNLTLSLGLRFETQNYIHDKSDLAPRFGFSYGIRGTDKKPAVYTLRGGFGLFYTRLPSTNILTAVRQNGVTQQQYVVTSPDTYPALPPLNSLSGQTSPTIFRVSPNYTSPYVMQSGLELERSLGKYGSISGYYTNTRGVHLLLSRNINAPLPGTYDPADPTSGVRPLGGTQNLYQYDAMGVSRSDRLGVHTQITNGEKLFVFASYSYRRQRTDTNGGFPSNQYNVGQDYGRATNDFRQRLFLGTFLQLPYHFGGGVFVIAQGGEPFNITLGQDVNGDSQFNDRPSFATDLSRGSVVQTAYGNFDMDPIAGQRIIPINYGNGPGLTNLNLFFNHTIKFGPEPKTPPDAPPPAPLKAGEKPPPKQHRYTLGFGVEAQNVLNHVNPAPPVGVLGSALFGKSNALNSAFSQGSANRIINLQGSFQF